MFKTVCIFGGSGFLGHYLAQRLLQQGMKVLLVSRKKAKFYDDLFAQYGEKIDHLQFDINDEQTSIDHCFSYDVIINLVGILYEWGEQNFENLHVLWPKRLSQMALKHDVEVCIHFSALGADFDSPSKYAVSKAKGEKLFLKYYKKGVIIRPSVVFGRGDGFVNRFYQMSRFSPFLPVFGKGDHTMQPIYVLDVCSCVQAIIATSKFSGRIIEVGGDGVYSFKDIMKQIIFWSGKMRWLIHLPYFLGEIMGVVLQYIMPSVLTYDQVQLLKQDNVCGAKMLRAKDLGVKCSDFMKMRSDEVIMS